MSSGKEKKTKPLMQSKLLQPEPQKKNRQQPQMLKPIVRHAQPVSLSGAYFRASFQRKMLSLLPIHQH